MRKSAQIETWKDDDDDGEWKLEKNFLTRSCYLYAILTSFVIKRKRKVNIYIVGSLVGIYE